MRYINKKDGFKHEKLIVLPEPVQDQLYEDPLTSSLFITDIGYFPSAAYHYRQRLEGSPNHVLLFCVDGGGYVDIDKRHLHLNKNDLLIIPAAMAHTYYSDDHKPWSIYWLHFNGEQSPAFVRLLQPSISPIPISREQHAELIHLFTTIFIQLESGYSRAHLLHVTSLLHLFFTTILQTASTGNVKQTKNNPYIREAITYMQDHINDQLTTKDMAQPLNLSPSYLSHYFKEKTGYAPIDYFIQLKVQKACHLLDTTNLYIKEIAQELGYSDPYYFSRLFKKVMTMSPKVYREMEKG